MSRIIDILKAPFNFFTKDGKKSQRKYYYHMLLTNFKDVEGYSLLLGGAQYKDKISTPVVISLLDDVPLSQLSKKLVQSKFGAPKFSTHISLGSDTLELLVFKPFFSNLRSKLIVLSKGEEILFYCYVFTLLEPMEKRNIFSLLENKYFLGKQLNSKKEILRDPQGTSLTILDDIYLFVSVCDQRMNKYLQS
jgi:hypothetical protein